jgi:cytidylate kinase
MAEIKWTHRHHPRNVEFIVEQQVRRWQLRPERTSAEGGHYWPVVTISREFGSLGLALGQRVAERLGFSFWDHEIVSAVASQLHVAPDKVGAIDEHPVGAMAQLFNALNLGRDDIAADYHDQLRLLLASIGRRGAAIIVGRGAHMATDPAHTLRVRLVAPLVHRVRDYQARYGTTTEEAYRQVRAGDKERADFVRQAYHADVAEPTFYDVVINVATFGPERADSLVLMAYLAKFGEIPIQLRESVPHEGEVSTRPAPMAGPYSSRPSPLVYHP